MRQPLECQRNAAGDEVRIQIELGSPLNEPFKIVSDQRLTPCQVELDDTQELPLLQRREATCRHRSRVPAGIAERDLNNRDIEADSGR